MDYYVFTITSQNSKAISATSCIMVDKKKWKKDSLSNKHCTFKKVSTNDEIIKNFGNVKSIINCKQGRGTTSISLLYDEEELCKKKQDIFSKLIKGAKKNELEILFNTHQSDVNFQNVVYKFIQKAHQYEITSKSYLCIISIGNIRNLKIRELICVGTYSDGYGNKTCNGKLININNSMGKKPFYISTGECNKKVILKSLRTGNLASATGVYPLLSTKGKYFAKIIKDELNLANTIKKIILPPNKKN